MRGVRSFGWKPCREPVELSVYVVGDLLEAKALEPPRGSWARVSGRVPAVDEYRSGRIELFLRLGFEASEGEGAWLRESHHGHPPGLDLTARCAHRPPRIPSRRKHLERSGAAPWPRWSRVGACAGSAAGGRRGMC
jgi:hypothetical protein